MGRKEIGIIRIIGWRMEGGRTEIIRLREAPEHL